MINSYRNPNRAKYIDSRGRDMLAQGRRGTAYGNEAAIPFYEKLGFRSRLTVLELK